MRGMIITMTPTIRNQLVQLLSKLYYLVHQSRAMVADSPFGSAAHETAGLFQQDLEDAKAIVDDILRSEE
jgi:hypothetical protein